MQNVGFEVSFRRNLRSERVTPEMFRDVVGLGANIRNSPAADSSSGRICLGWCKGNENKMIYSYFRVALPLTFATQKLHNARGWMGFRSRCRECRCGNNKRERKVVAPCVVHVTIRDSFFKALLVFSDV
jgi:hypothetical protein